MKKPTKSAFILFFSVSLLVIGVGAISTSSAQDISTENVLLQKLDALVEQLANLASNQSSSVSSSTADGQTTLQSSSGNINPGCYDNYLSWPSSANYNSNVPWSFSNFPSGNPGQSNGLQNYFADLNGDGLLDYLNFNRSNTSFGSTIYNSDRTCVLLNNGSGWDIAYRCITGAVYNNGVVELRFFGDCAQI